MGNIMPNAKPPKTLDSVQQEDLLNALRRDDSPTKTYRKGIRNYLIGCLMLDAGLRVGEVVQLTVAHLWFSDNPVRSLVLTSDITKNHKERTVPVNTRLSSAIVEFISSHFSNTVILPTYRVFNSTSTGKSLTTRQVENIINNAASKSIGRLINPHMLRHTFASKLMRVTNMRTVQLLLGHSFLTSTQIYTHPNEDDKIKAVEDMSASDRLLNS